MAGCRFARDATVRSRKKTFPVPAKILRRLNFKFDFGLDL